MLHPFLQSETYFLALQFYQNRLILSLNTMLTYKYNVRQSVFTLRPPMFYVRIKLIRFVINIHSPYWERRVLQNIERAILAPVWYSFTWFFRAVSGWTVLKAPSHCMYLPSLIRRITNTGPQTFRIPFCSPSPFIAVSWKLLKLLWNASHTSATTSFSWFQLRS